MTHFDKLPVNKRKHYYRLLYADPPFAYDRILSKRDGGMTYSTMSISELIQMGPSIKEICNPESCLIFMWIMWPKMDQGLSLMQAWGFKYVTCGFNWIKTCKKDHSKFFSNQGFYTKPNSEVCLIGRMGKSPEILDKTVKQVVVSPLRGHSQKPDEVRDMLNKMFGDIPKIELFARFVKPGDPSGREPSKFTRGWDTFGNNDFGDGFDKTNKVKKSRDNSNEEYFDQDEEYSDLSGNESKNSRSRSNSQSDYDNDDTNSSNIDHDFDNFDQYNDYNNRNNHYNDYNQNNINMMIPVAYGKRYQSRQGQNRSRINNRSNNRNRSNRRK